MDSFWCNAGVVFKALLVTERVILVQGWGHRWSPLGLMFGIILGSMLIHFGTILGAILAHFGVILGPLGHFGPPGSPMGRET